MQVMLIIDFRYASRAANCHPREENENEQNNRELGGTWVSGGDGERESRACQA
jgi:hypothetical protein